MKNDAEEDEMMKCQLRIGFEILMDQKIDKAVLRRTNPSGIDARCLLSSTFPMLFESFFIKFSLQICRLSLSILFLFICILIFLQSSNL